MEGGVSYEMDERCFSEGSCVAGMVCEGLRCDGAGCGGMIASLSSSSGGGVHGDRRVDVLLMGRMEMIQLVGLNVSKLVHLMAIQHTLTSRWQRVKLAI
jgi:hypothetical protein